MLTENELAWLKRRQFFNGFYSSGCLTCSLNKTLCDKADCLLHPDLEDALEFSERVVAELAGMMLKPNRYPCRGGFPPLGCMRDWSNLTDPMAVHCEDCILREVRLQVEEEMDADIQAKD